MMDLRGFINKIRDSRRIITSNRRNNALKAGNDLLALVKLRNQARGENKDGIKYVPYTPLSRVLRTQKGYQTAYVDFTQTGRMWANIHPYVESENLFSITININAILGSERDKLEEQFKKRGNILEPSKSELAILSTIYSQKVLNQLSI